MTVSNEFKVITKKIKQQDSKITLKETNNKLETKQIRYSFEGQLFKTIMKQIVFTTKNINLLKGKNLNFQYGLFVNNEFEYIDLGDFYIKDVPESNKGSEEAEITAYDKMVHFMKNFKQSEMNMSYPCTMSDFVNRMCEICGVTLYSTDFFNNDLMILEDYFTAQGITYRDVLVKVAQATLSTIYIKENKLFLAPISSTTEETLDRSYLSKLVITDKFGPVNALVLGRGDVEDNIEAKDQASIDTNGRCEIRFDENEFIDSQREQVINKMFEKIKGLTYYAFEGADVGIMWLEPTTSIALKDNETDIYNSYYLEADITINTGIKSSIEAQIPEVTNTEYKVTTEEEKKTLKVERLAKKNEGIIQDLVKENSEFEEKLTQITQDVDGISAKVENMADLTRDITGIKNITLNNCIAGTLLELHIYGNNTVFDYLYPSYDLYPSDDLYPHGDSIIEVTNYSSGSEEGTTITYDLGITDVLRQNGDTADEYVLKEGKAQIIRRINKDGTIKEKEEIEDLGTFNISLLEGENYIEIKNYIATISAKYIIKNDYTDIIATKVEMKTEIRLLSDAIQSEVNKKIDETELGTKIIQNWESIKYAWNQISQYLKMEGIDGKATFNVYNENNIMLMSLGQDGQCFYDEQGNKIGTVGIVREDNKNIIAFAMNVDWENVTESKSMAWGFFDKDNNFLPIFYLQSYYGDETSEYGGDLVIEGNLTTPSLIVINNTIKSGDTNMNFIDNNGNPLLSIIPEYVDFYDKRLRNMKNVATTDENLNYIAGSANSHIFASFKDGGSVIVFENSSDKNLKKNIEDSKENALKKIMKIRHRSFDWKKDNEHQDIGYIAQELIEIDNTFVHHLTYKDRDGSEKENWQINDLSVLATVTKAIQEQQKQIEEIKQEIEKLKKGEK